MHFLKTKFILLFILLFSHVTYGEIQPIIDHITSNNGLSHNTIRCIIQDKTGFLWFGSLNGLNRYDGIQIKTFVPEAQNPNSLSSGKIKELHLDSYGHIWVRTYSDIIHCYDPLIDNFVQLYTKKSDQYLRYNLYYEDNQKNVWLGSVSSGCVRFSFKNGDIEVIHYNATSAVNQILSNTVNYIFQDSRLNTWILTSKGINRLVQGKLTSDPIKNKGNLNFIKAYEINKKVFLISDKGIVKIFDLIKNKFENNFNLNIAVTVSQIALIRNDSLIISTFGKGVYIFNPIKLSVTSADSFYGENISGNVSFLENENHDILAYNLSGNAWLWIKSTNKIVKLKLIPDFIMKLIDEERYQFIADKRDNVWISTYGNGLFCYNIRTGNLSHLTHSPTQNGLASNYLLSMILDKNDNIWLGTENMGINKLSFLNRNVQLFFPDHQHNFQSGNVIRAFLEDQHHNIWVATKAGNLYIYDSNLSHKKVVYENGYNVYSMLQDPDGTIWLATKNNGIVGFKDGKITNALHYKKESVAGSLSNNTVFSIVKDHQGRLWAATFGGGVCVKTTPKGTLGFRTFFDNDDWLRFARYIFMDKKGDLWVGTTNGILRFNPDKLLQNAKNFRYYTFNVESKNCLSNPEVRYIFQDSRGFIWIGTAGGGVNKFLGESSTGNGIFKVYNNKQGMANDNIMGIQEDKSGCLWVSTENGLLKLNPQTNLFQYYRFSDDFSSNLFSETACLTCKNNKMLWGSLKGFYVFNPADIKMPENETNHVVFTGFSLFDQPAKINKKNAPLKESVTFSDRIDLQSSDKVFHIEFANLNFRDPKANQFMYILENFEKRWNLSGSVNVATYRNVPPGKYIFMVKSLNSEGLWDAQVTKLLIVIHPPFWLTDFAIFIYFLILVALGYFALKLIRKFNNLNNAIKVERQLTDYKLRFFTNISHEFRTPLTLIKGSVDTLTDIKNKMTEPLQQLVTDLEKNTAHLLRLIDQLLEFRKLQNNKQKLNLQNTEIIGFLNDIFHSFSNVSSKMHIEYNFVHALPELTLFIDRDKVDKIVFNLLSNAFKFTPRGGKISLIVEVDESKESIRIAVADNGIGIPKEKQNLLFSRFMQINFSASGTGIGLSLVNEFTNLHKGTTGFQENMGGGSVFYVEFPLKSDIYNSDDFLNENVIVQKEYGEEVYPLSDFIKENDNKISIDLLPHSPILNHKYKILVIDDNDDIRQFLDEKLSPYFEVITAEDGDIGIHRSMNDDPDLIICDVMMPGMNGFDLTKKLKEDFSTCHIPIVLLTAYVADEHELEGIESGAEAYISKPFSMRHLMLQINKLLEKNERLHKHFASNENALSFNEEIRQEFPDKDAQFLNLIEELLEEHLADPTFSVDEFATLANTGRTLFFKKIKFLTGYTPNDFIRIRRLKKAAELLKTYKYNVSEVSYMVGINDPFYFSKCFKAQYGCSPSHYINS